MKQVMVMATGAISRAKLQSNGHYQETNTQLFTGRMPFLSPNQQCQSTEGKKYQLHRLVQLIKSSREQRKVKVKKVAHLI